MAANVPTTDLPSLVSIIGAPAAIFLWLWWQSRGSSKTDKRTDSDVIRYEMQNMSGELRQLARDVVDLREAVADIKARQEERGK
jgi:hypothetical protein